MKRINWWGTEHADKDGKSAGGWGGIGGRQPNKKKSKRPKNATWGGPSAAAQLSWLESVALCLACKKETERLELEKLNRGSGRGDVGKP